MLYGNCFDSVLEALGHGDITVEGNKSGTGKPIVYGCQFVSQLEPVVLHQ